MFTKLYLISLVIFVAMDLLWLGLIAKSFYTTQIGSLMKADINWIAASIFYVLFALGLVVFVLTPAVTAHSFNHAIVYGALFGCISYATYDLTNLATLQGWTLRVALVDIVWGTLLALFVSGITYILATH
jgi:uncharacterized membrane protein